MGNQLAGEERTQKREGNEKGEGKEPNKKNQN
jgi:hypothetical protein